jgi:DNA-binding transcriptional ArsR family regulator
MAVTDQLPGSDPRAPAEFIDLSELGDRPIRLAQSLLPSVLALVGDALGALPHGAPDEWRRAVRSALGRRDLAALLPVFGNHAILLPDCLTPIPRSGAMSMADTVELIAATDPDELLRQAADEYGDTPPAAWRHVEARPGRWLQAYAAALGRAADAIAPVWRAAGALLDRETERVGAAAVLGAERELLGSLHARGRLDGDRLLLDRRGSEPAAWRLDPHGLVLVPMLGGTGALVSWHANQAVTHLAYPMPGRARLLDAADAPGGGLDGLLGGPRALILRVLDRPATAGAVAAALQAVPSAATHHVAALEAAGLVVRERSGQNVVVHRTARGTALLALYDS